MKKITTINISLTKTEIDMAIRKYVHQKYKELNIDESSPFKISYYDKKGDLLVGTCDLKECIVNTKTESENL